MKSKAAIARTFGRFRRWMPRLAGGIKNRSRTTAPHRPPEPTLLEFRDQASYALYRSRNADMIAERQRVTEALKQAGDCFHVHGYCDPCEQFVDLRVDYQGTPNARASGQPNWRERLVCPCGLNNRMRAAIHVFRQHCRPRSDDPIYITEQVTPLYRWLAKLYANVSGSEYLGKTIPFGTQRKDAVRNETLTALSFAADSFQYILSFDVLEHVPDYRQALAELHRVLRADGVLLFSAPFISAHAETTIRARVDTKGEIKHLLTPEYHGDPLSDAGCLCFYHFGWDLLDTCRAVGFRDAYVVALWSREYGYLGPEQLLFVARK
ncbi:MAG: class I SAM-dependent methyltransferase [Lamprobacter sp.]|uniref:class I SAM-dependent methyltransferase n=1 Tax=Lamprobacter sp. TaxID=3100796 RepID=UPI002B25C97C|nr:class I SAM-dependent methyltransferase [Lamprobacter sp.]MEA3638332.1 class I SAM-dependent methyltransferase [Lamprobacter sp.]